MKDVVQQEIIEGKIYNLLKTNALLKLKECEEKIFEFESKYFMDIDSFKKAWEKDDIKDKYSHEVERDYMEWEGFEYERKKWLKILQEVNVKN